MRGNFEQSVDNKGDYYKGKLDAIEDNSKAYKIAFGWTLAILLIVLFLFGTYVTSITPTQITNTGLTEERTLQMCIDIAKAMR